MVENNIHSHEDLYFGISNEIFEDVSVALQYHDFKRIKKLLKPIHAADIADLIQKLTPQDRLSFIKLMKPVIDPETLTFLTEEIRDMILPEFGLKFVASAISDLESDDAVEIIENLDREEQKAVLKAIPSKERLVVEKALAYPEDSAGRMMQRENICVPAFWTVKETLNFIRKADNIPDQFNTIYIIDSKYHLVGTLSVQKILRRKNHIVINDIMDPEAKTIDVLTDQEEVAHMFHHYSLTALPVVDENNRMVGAIYSGDVIEVIEEEAEEDILHSAGVNKSDFYASSLTAFLRRSPYLFLTMINCILSYFLIAQFETIFAKNTSLIAFLPFAGAMGGNVGVQVVTIIMRALINKELFERNMLKSLFKEISIASLNGIVFAISLGIFAAYITGESFFAYIVAGALFFNILWAGIMGTLLPICFEKMGFDPSLGSTPILSILTDLSGFGIYCAFANFILS